MSRKRIAIIITAAAMVVGMGLAANEYASAQGRGWGARPAFFGGGSGFHHMGFGGGPIISQALAMKDQLKLTEDQVQKLEKLRTDFYQKAAKERIEMQALRLEIQKLHLADKLDVGAAEKQIRAMEKKRADLQVARLKAIEQGKEVLTPAQIKQLETTGFGPGARFGRGGFGPGYGRGGYGMGPGMMGPGYGRGGHMGPGFQGGGGYGPGMMGPGYGRGMGPGWGTETPATPPTQQQ